MINLKITFAIIAILFLIQSAISQPPIQLVDQPVKLNHLAFNLKVLRGYRISVAAQGLERPRFFEKSPDGRLFITDMHDRSDNKKGRVLILEGWNEKEKRFDSVTTFLNNLHNPNQVIFYFSNNKYLLYVAETDKLSFYSYNSGDKKPTSPPTTVADFPDYGLNYKYGGWHLTRSLAIHNNKIYVSVGSSCNACIENEQIRATIIEMDPNGSHQRIYARGLRNSVGIGWVKDQLWGTNMGRDLIGPDKPEDLLQPINLNGYYGWPFYVQYRRQIISDASFKDSTKAEFVVKPPVAPWGFKAHSAPLGFEFFSNFTDPILNNSFIVALHGSTSVWRQRGNAIVQMLPKGTYRDIVTGFLQGKTEGKRFGRPCDVLQWTSDSFFISDDKNGVIYFVWKEH